MIKTFKGLVIDEYSLKNKTWKYCIKNNKEKQYFISFDDYKIIMHYDVNIRYKICKNPKYGDSKNIINVEYLKITENMKHIKHILYDVICLTSTTVNDLTYTLKKNTMKIIINEFEKIKPSSSNSKDNTFIYIDEDDYKKIKKYRKCDMLRIVQSFFNEMNIKYNNKWYNKIISHYGENNKNLLDEIKKNPYDLYSACKIPFEIVDTIGCKLFFIYHPDRINSIIDFIYKKQNNLGVIYLSKKQIIDYTKSKKITISDNVLKLLIRNLKKITINDNDYYTTSEIYFMEKYIENFCNELKNCEVRVSDDYNKDELYDKDLKNNSLTKTLDPEQVNAIDMIIRNKICIITGAPGTGKSYTITSACEKLQTKTYILAPTGTAVQKLKSEINKKNQLIECQTIHLFLTKLKSKANSKLLDYNSEISIFIDEMSMVSLQLFYDLLFNLQNINNIRLILSGDKNQLPSIQGGNIFEDMIKYSSIPISELKHQRRTEGQILVKNANLILNGKNIEPDNNILIFKECNTIEEIDNTLWSILENQKHNIKVNNSIILIPTREKGICTNYYNKKLQDYYNPNSEKICSNKKFEFRINDKIINKKNNYIKKVYNGSILTIKSFSYNEIQKNKNGDSYVVEFLNNKMVNSYPYKHNIYKNNQQYNHKLECLFHEDEENLTKGKLRKYEKEELNMIELAYATTIHSAQGKGYKTVIIILHSSMYSELLTRKMLYTALTRTKTKCIIIGDKKSLEYCKKIDRPRITNLFQNNITSYDMICFILNNIHKYIKYTNILHFLTEIKLDHNNFKHDITINYKKYDTILTILLSNTDNVIELYKILENNELCDNINNRSNNLISIDTVDE